MPPFLPVPSSAGRIARGSVRAPVCAPVCAASCDPVRAPAAAPLALVAALLALASSLVGVTKASAQADTTCRFPADLAGRLLQGGFDTGVLSVEANFVVDEELLLESNLLRAQVQGRLDLGSQRLQPDARLCVFLLLDVDGEAILAHQNRLDMEDGSTVESLRYVLRADLPEGTRHMTFVVREAQGGLWGAAPLQQPGGEIGGPSFTAQRVDAYEGTYYELAYRQGASGAAPSTLADRIRAQKEAEAAAADAEADADAGRVLAPVPQRVQVPNLGRPRYGRPPVKEKLAGAQILRLVPPRDQPVRGGTIFNVLTSTVAVEKVVFEVDGERLEEDSRPPFRVRLPLADPPREQTVRAIAYDGLGVPMGEDVVVVNEVDAPFRVRITGFEGDPAAGSITIEARATVPPDARLEKLEVFSNEALVETSTALSLRTTVAVRDLQPTDYLRVAATLADGSTIDDVLLLATPEVEEVDVNLVELHAVVNDRKGKPVEDLEADDFRIVVDGEPRPTASFAYADDVPLVLGLVVDTSASMETMMHDTRRAAAKFLGQTVQQQDKAFIVDFDLQPRLVHDVTGDLPTLMRSLARLEADGRTAMYDAVVFALLQFEAHAGRRALVVLTDGDDLDSRFGPTNSAQMAREAGVPVYIIGLGAFGGFERSFSKRDLRTLTGDTGGGLYFVDSFEELADAYARINAELRSQYSLGFYAERDLTTSERSKVKVEVPKGMAARTVVGVGER